jgi:antigen flippase
MKAGRLKAVQKRWMPQGAASSAGTIGAVLVMNAVSGILAARLLGPSGRGSLALALVWAGLVSQLAEPGLNQALTYFAGKDPPRLQQLWGQALVTATVLALVAMPVAGAVSGLLVDDPQARRAILIALLSLLPSYLSGYQLSLLRGLGDFRSYNRIRLIQGGLWLVAVAAFTAASLTHLEGLLLCFVGSVVASAVLSARGVWRNGGPPRFESGGLGPLLRYGAATWVAGVGHQANARIDQFFLGTMVAASVLGQYAAAVGIASSLNVISMGLVVVTVPGLVRASPAERLRVGQRNVGLGFVLMAAAATVLALFAPVLVPALLGNAFASAVPLLRILLLGQVALGATQILHEVARGLKRLRFPATVEAGAAAVTMLVLVVVIPRWGAAGAAWTSAAVYWATALVLGFGLLRPRARRAGNGTNVSIEGPEGGTGGKLPEGCR